MLSWNQDLMVSLIKYLIDSGRSLGKQVNLDHIDLPWEQELDLYVVSNWFPYELFVMLWV